MRRAAVKSLGIIGGAEAIETLVLSLTDEERMVRIAAEASLERIDPAWAQTTQAQHAKARLEASLNKCSPWVRSAVQQVLTRLTEATGKPPS